MKIIPGGVTAAKGFLAACTAAGIKYQNRIDMAMIYSTQPCQCAGTFTSNAVKAAPVLWDRDIVENSAYAQAVVINAGVANACTGAQGMEYCKKTADAAGGALSLPSDAILVASTGVIGKQLPVDRIIDGTKVMAKQLSDSIEAGTAASRAIMTTDTKNKEIAVEFLAGGKRAVLGGMCKGSGMIHPDMCTMLAFLTTDVSISRELLSEALSEDIKDTYNMISVDGDTSTNDTVLLLANGLAENPMIVEKNADYEEFVKALRIVNEHLAKSMAEDGEGATKLFEVKAIHAKTKEQAVALSKSVASSSLVKAMLYGNDANWGRVLCAMGYSGAKFHPDQVDVYVESEEDGRLMLAQNGMAADYSEEIATKILSAKKVTAILDLKEGEAAATAWGCDLTYDYIKINADYRS